jgi:PAS domain S-box-containing protein
MQRRDRNLQPEGRLKAMLQEMDEAAVFKSADGSVVLWNRMAAELFGYTAPEIVGQNAEILLPDGERQFWHDFEKRLRGGSAVRRVAAVRIAKGGGRVRVMLKTVVVDKARPGRSEILDLYRPLSFRARNKETKAAEERQSA